MERAVGNKLIFGDCLDVMLGADDRGRAYIPDGSVDLVYLDPPFNSKANYNMIFGKGRDKQAQMTAFTDTWQWGGQGTQDVMEIKEAVEHPAHKAINSIYHMYGESGLVAYLGYMAKRLALVHGKMKDTASIYLHCDSTANNYLNMVMADIFGEQNFQNSVVWQRTAGRSVGRRWGRVHDTILFYTKSQTWTWNNPAQSRNRKHYGQVSQDEWTDDVFDDIPPESSHSKRRTGYPTQKPVRLLERIIRASSNPGDVVFDPFCGCGTTIVAAEGLGRRWIGIDISAAAIRIITESRSELQMAKYEMHGIPKGMEEARKLAELNRLQYEHWAISTVPGLAPNDRRNQEGFDGIGIFNVPVPGNPGKVTRKTVTAEVKSGKDGVTAAQRSHLKNHTSNNKSELGIFLTLERDSATERWCKQQGNYQMPGVATPFPRFQVFSAEQYFAGGRPHLPPLLDPMTGQPLQMSLPAP